MTTNGNILWRVTLHRNKNQWHSWHETKADAIAAQRAQRSRRLGRVTLKPEKRVPKL